MESESKTQIKKFQITIPEEALDELRRESRKTGASMASIIKMRIAVGRTKPKKMEEQL